MMQLAILGSNKPLIWLVQPRYLIGRGSGCDIQLADEKLLDVHLQLDVDGDQITLMPLGEAEIQVNGSAIESGRRVQHGDYLRLGRSELRLVDPKQRQLASENKPQGWALQGLSAALSDRRYDITGTHTVGRAADCDISLGVAHLSRQHARLISSEQGLVVEDLGSANGTFVNNKRIDKATLKSGDELKFDTLRFRVVEPGVEIDSDKTSLRPAVVTPLPREQPRQQPRSTKPAARARTLPQPAQPVEPEVIKAASSSSWAWWILGAGLLIALGAIWFVGF